ncbi:hypothetical protein [uncultured Marinobacter sp.]|uniref:hypothetical protein n=1 Tax=uncultured Marinobacter sp. TaxID=187379 RepID=UPI002597C441|nr:hypothetical protein [uncultured Marinobacter sp.]
MTTDITYDPKTKALIKDRLYEHLYAPVKESFNQRLKTIIVKNSVLHGNDQQWLSYKGEYYAIDQTQPRPRPMNRLHKELTSVMNEYVNDLEYLNQQELPYVLGFINNVLNSSNSLQDYFRIFPESIHGPLKDVADRCACKENRLAPETVKEIQQKNQIPIELMKKRMVLNLLI